MVNDINVYNHFLIFIHIICYITFWTMKKGSNKWQMNLE
jgi:hypothetical protein